MYKIISLILIALGIYFVFQAYHLISLEQVKQKGYVLTLQKSLNAISESKLQMIDVQAFNKNHIETISKLQTEKCDVQNLCAKEKLMSSTQQLIESNKNKTMWSEEVLKCILKGIAFLVFGALLHEYKRFRR